MMDYLKAAFFLRFKLPGLGDLPLNIIGLSAFAVLGLGHPAFWLMGLGLEIAYLFGLLTNRNFQNYVKTKDLLRLKKSDAAKREALLKHLGNQAHARIVSLEKKCERILRLQQDMNAGASGIYHNADALKGLQWSFIKLLIGQHFLQSPESRGDELALKKQIAQLEQELTLSGITEAARRSKQATLQILTKRLKNLEKREQTLNEIESSLVRIEAQIDLALENTTLDQRPDAEIGADIEVASFLLEEGYFGSFEESVAELDAAYHVDRKVAKSSKTAIGESQRDA